MTGYDILKRARGLLGYSGADTTCGGLEPAARESLEIINQIAADLKVGGLSSVAEELDITAAKAEALCYGVAMLSALAEGDADRNRIFAAAYNAKRGTALAVTESVEDCLPKVTVG
ncbi:MAG: hypothetical protein ACI4F7_08705 [Acutalibacteraceae bacterium]